VATERIAQLIDHRTFVAGRALSFHDQPYLGLMFSAVRDSDIPLTLVVGAGVSMNAGLRSWPELVDCMADQIDDERLRDMAKKDRSDLLRRAEIVLQLVKAENHNKEDHEIVRDALYQKDLSVTAGQSAMSIARLVAVRRRNIRLITTNFDTILEEALRRHFPKDQVRSYALDDLDRWQESLATDTIGVLHVHGVVPQGAKPKEPLVLTESQFFKHGAVVRKVIFDNLHSSCSVFVGLSMSDPNLVGPVYELTNQNIDSPRFALSVPELAPGAHNDVESARYAVESAKFMERELQLKTIFLKSYSQLNQVLSDLSLAVVEPERYRDRPADKAPSLIYGRRLAKALEDCYVSVGCERNQHVPIGESATTLNNRLHNALHGSGGPATVLRRFARIVEGCRIGGEQGENFGLSLWLRRRYHPQGKSRYSLNLIGTSAYTHREPWSLRRELDITRDSNVAAVQAVFRGTPVAVNMEPSPHSPIWRGIVALPIVMESIGSDRSVDGVPVDTLMIGAITLNSTREVKKPQQPNGPDGFADLSIITTLDSARMNELFASVQRAAAMVLLENP
jgi:hypothetical protein